MGLLQPHAGHRRGDGAARLTPAKAAGGTTGTTTGRAVSVLGHAQARVAVAAAAAAGAPITLISACGAAAFAGPGWFQGLVAALRREWPDTGISAILDCGDMPGHALAALRHGIDTIRYNGPAAAQIADIARQCNATVLRERPQALDLAALDENLESACRAWFDSATRDSEY